jgi:hypothetical protein
MVYKILTDFEEGLDNIIKELSLDFMVLFYRNAIYIAKKEGRASKQEVDNDLKKIIKATFYCQELDETNLKYEPLKAMEWCKEQFVRIETQLFEKEKQEELQAMWNFIQAVDNELAILSQNNIKQI